MKTFKIGVVAILTLALTISTTVSHANTNVSTYTGYPYKNVAPWYETGIKEAEAWKVIPDRFRKLSMDQPITRGEFAEAIV